MVDMGNYRESKNFIDITSLPRNVQLLFQHGAEQDAQTERQLHDYQGDYNAYLNKRLQNLTPQDIYVMKTHGLTPQDMETLKAVQEGRIAVDPKHFGDWWFTR